MIGQGRLYAIIAVLALVTIAQSPREAAGDTLGNVAQAPAIGFLVGTKVDGAGRPIALAGTTISIRRLSDGQKAGFNDYGPSFGPDQHSFRAALPAGLYEIGIQVPRGYSVEWSVSSAKATERKNGILFPPGNAYNKAVIVSIVAGEAQQLTLRFIRQLAEQPEPIDVTQTLHCNIAGGPAPIGPTDTLSFNGSGADVKVGINRNLGNIIVLLEAFPPGTNGNGANLIEARSAGGAAWQAGVGGTDADLNEIIHYNQGGGNSARNWGFEAPLTAGHQSGFVQQKWMPLYANDHRPADASTDASVTTSPCYATGERLGDALTKLVPTWIKTPSGATVVRLTYDFSVRHRIDSSWSRFQQDYAMYLNPNMRSLRVFYPASNGVVGPIFPYTNLTRVPKNDVRNEFCRDGDCLLATPSISYVVLVWTINGKSVAMAIHLPNNERKFFGFLRFRPHVTCVNGEKCGGVQFHAMLEDTLLFPNGQRKFRKGEIVNYRLVYDFGSLEELAQLGYTTTAETK